MNSFNILHDPFIFAQYSDGKTQEVSLLTMLTDSSEIQSVSGSTPLQQFLFVRLGLAYMYRAFKPDTPTWNRIWENKAFSDEDILTLHNYGEEYNERFELLHPSTPFYQIPNAEYVKGKEASNGVLFLDKNTVPGDAEKFLFKTYSHTGTKRVSFNEAARRLIEVNAYNVASKRSTIQGDPRKKKYGYAQPGWNGNFTGILLEGETLFQTLMLNWVPYDFLEIDPEEDKSVWERPPLTPAPEGLYGDKDESRTPDGPADTYTQQVTRATLVADKGEIVNTIMGIGDRLFSADKVRIEPMASWYPAKTQEGTISMFPFKAQHSQSWRNLAAILTAQTRTSVKDHEGSVAANLRWNKKQSRKIQRVLGRTESLSTYQAIYGAQDAIITDIAVSRIALPVDLIEKTYLKRVAIKAVDIAENLSGIVRGLQEDLFVASGKERKPAKGVSAQQLAASSKEAYLYDAEEMFLRWAINLTEENAEDNLNEWWDNMKSLVRIHARKILSEAPPSTVKGSLEGDKTINVFTAERNFERKLAGYIKKNQGAQEG